MAAELITGANGQLGRALREYFPLAKSTDSDTLDITSIVKLEEYNWEGIETIINAAAYTNVDGAELDENKELAAQVNEVGVRNLADIATKRNITLVHVSTDYVFDGLQQIHDENEPPTPLSWYGKTKAGGDSAAQSTSKHYIFRTSWVIGEGKNFVKTMLSLGKQGISPKVVADQLGRPTFSTELARGIRHVLNVQPEYGIYNLTNEGDPVSWATLAKEIFEIAKFRSEVIEISTDEYNAGKSNVAPRPENSTLLLTKIELTGFTPHDWREDLKNYVERELITL